MTSALAQVHATYAVPMVTSGRPEAALVEGLVLYSHAESTAMGPTAQGALG